MNGMFNVQFRRSRNLSVVKKEKCVMLGVAQPQN